MVYLSPNSHRNRPVDVGPSPKGLRSLHAFCGAKLFAPRGAFSQAVRLCVPSFTGTTLLGVPNPENLDCHYALDLRPTRSIAQVLKNYPSKDGGVKPFGGL